MSLDYIIVGPPRSGTTLLGRVLSANSRVAFAGETYWMPYLLEAGRVCRRYSGSLRPDLDEYWTRLVRKVNRDLLPWAECVGMKLIGPRNSTCLAETLRIHPEARVLLCARDIRDSFVSSLRKNTAAYPVDVNFTFERIVEQTREAGVELQVVRYEDLVTDPVSTVRAVCEYLDLELEREMLLPFTERISGNQTPALKAEELEQGIIHPDPANVERWRSQLCDEDLLDMAAFRDSAARFGYATVDMPGTRLVLEADAEPHLELLGCALDHGGRTARGHALTVDVSCLGAAGIRVLNPECNVRSARLGDAELVPSPVYPDVRLARLTGCAYVGVGGNDEREQRAFSFPSLCRTSWLDGRPLALYTAGNSTRMFLDRFTAKGLDGRHEVACVLDRAGRGVIRGMQVRSPREFLPGFKGYIAVTSRPYYQQIAAFLTGQGFQEGPDFGLVSFADQEQVHVPLSVS